MMISSFIYKIGLLPDSGQSYLRKVISYIQYPSRTKIVFSFYLGWNIYFTPQPAVTDCKTPKADRLHADYNDHPTNPLLLQLLPYERTTFL